MSNQFFYLDPHIFGHISSILVIKQVLDNIFQSTIVTYNFCMIPHSLIFSFNFTRFGLKQNPTGLQEAIQRSDKNSKTTLIIKSTLERSFLIKKNTKKSFLEYCTFHQIQPTYSYPMVTYSDPKVTHSDPTHLPLPPPASPDNCQAIR